MNKLPLYFDESFEVEGAEPGVLTVVFVNLFSVLSVPLLTIISKQGHLVSYIAMMYSLSVN